MKFKESKPIILTSGKVVHLGFSPLLMLIGLPYAIYKKYYSVAVLMLIIALAMLRSGTDIYGVLVGMLFFGLFGNAIEVYCSLYYGDKVATLPDDVTEDEFKKLTGHVI